MAVLPIPMPWNPGSTPTGPTCQWGSGRSCSAMIEPRWRKRSASFASGSGWVEGPHLGWNHRRDAVPRRLRRGHGQDALTSPDPGHPRGGQHLGERAVAHLETDQGIVGDSQGCRAVPQGPCRHSRRLRCLVGAAQPRRFEDRHVVVLADRRMDAPHERTPSIGRWRRFTRAGAGRWPARGWPQSRHRSRSGGHLPGDGSPRCREGRPGGARGRRPRRWRRP